MEESDGPISFADLGINVTDSTKDTCFGKIQSCERLTKLEKVFLVVTLLCLVASLGITIERLVVSSKDSADFTFALVLFINILFCIYYVLNGVFFERPYEIGILVLATAVVWLYLVLNYAISAKGPYKLARLIVSSSLSPCVIVMGVLIARNYHESKNLIFRTVGAHATLQELCRTMFVYFDLLKADLQVSLSLALFILTSGQKLDLEDTILLPLSLVFGLASFVTGYLSVRIENKPVAIAYAVIWIAMPAYATYLIVRAAKDLQSVGDNTQTRTSLNAVIFVAAVACLLVRAATLYFGFKAYFNFGKGLTQKVYGRLTEEVSVNSTQRPQQEQA